MFFFFFKKKKKKKKKKEERFVAYEHFSEFIYTLIFDYYYLFHVTISFIIMFKLDK